MVNLDVLKRPVVSLNGFTITVGLVIAVILVYLVLKRLKK
jgi:hypothetical protein